MKTIKIITDNFEEVIKVPDDLCNNTLQTLFDKYNLVYQELSFSHWLSQKIEGIELITWDEVYLSE